jgi:hypothetical protein
MSRAHPGSHLTLTLDSTQCRHTHPCYPSVVNVDHPLVTICHAMSARGYPGRSFIATNSILLVDDDEIIRFALRDLLSDKGFIVTVADSVVGALKLINSQRFDVTGVGMSRESRPALQASHRSAAFRSALRRSPAFARLRSTRRIAYFAAGNTNVMLGLSL